MRNKITTLSIASGLTLIPLLPIGMFWGIGTTLFLSIFILHIAVLLFATVESSRYFFSLLPESQIFRISALFTAFAFVIGIFLLGVTPITARDALIHHLAVPKLWVEHGSIFQINWNDFSYYPMLINLGYTGLISLHLDRLSPAYHTFYLILFAGSVANLVYELSKDKKNSLLAFLITLSLPLCVHIGASPLVDIPLGLFCTIATTFALQISTQNNFAKGISLVGIALGLALSCKYNAILFVAVFIPLSAILIRGTRKDKLSYVFGITILSLLVFLPWLLKNSYWIGNPLHPLMKGFFGLNDGVVSSFNLPPLLARVALYGDSLLDIILTPFRMVILGADDTPKFYDGVLTPILVFSILPLFYFKSDKRYKILGLIAILYLYLSIVLGPSRIRYQLPVLGTFLALAAIGVNAFCDRFGRGKKLVFQFLLLLHFSFATIYLTSLFVKRGTFIYLSSPTDSETYLAHVINDYAMVSYMNQNMSQNGSTYLLYTGNEFYYHKTPVITSNVNPDRLLRKLLLTSDSGETLFLQFESLGIRNIMANVDRLNSALPGTLSDREKNIWNNFAANHLAPINSIGPYVLWKIQ